MKTLLKILLVLLLVFGHLTEITYTAGNINNTNQINLTPGGPSSGVDNSNNHLDSLRNDETDFTVATGGEKGIYNSMIRVALDLKNLFLILAGLFFLILVVRLLFSEKTEEEVSNFKKGIVWISIGIIVTQIAYYFINVLFDKEINVRLAEDFIEVIIWPFINLLETAASFFFIAIMIYAFFKMVTANGDEEKVKSGKMSVLYAIIGFIVIRFSKELVEAIYGKTNCRDILESNCVNQTDLEGFAYIAVQIIDWANSFVGIIVVLMTIYAGFLVLTGAGDEEKIKKAKNIIFYIIIGLAVLISNYLIFTFFIFPESQI